MVVTPAGDCAEYLVELARYAQHTGGQAHILTCVYVSLPLLIIWGRANATGYYNRGEVEDYRVIVDNTVLGIPLLSFEAKAGNDNKVKLQWTANEEAGYQGYNIQRSNGAGWERIAFIPASQSTGQFNYDLVDDSPYTGTSSYRIVVNETNGSVRFSNIRSVRIRDVPESISMFPNPAVDKATISVSGVVAQQAGDIRILDANNNSVLYKKITLMRGNNTIEMPFYSTMMPGIYIVQVNTGRSVINKKLIIRR